MKNKLLKRGSEVIRILYEKDDNVFVMDCINLNMPVWCKRSEIADFELCSETDLPNEIYDLEMLDDVSRGVMHKRFTLIAGVLPFVSDAKFRNRIISKISEQNQVSKQTIRKYLCLYLAYQNIAILAPGRKSKENVLSIDEKNMRWALNKFFYTKNNNSLKTAYAMMLKEKYCDSANKLCSEYPSFYQFRYFYRKHRSLQNYYISRNGLSDYQRNFRPLTGNGMLDFASNIGVGMLDATVCDIYLVNEEGSLIGRPVLTACIDAYSSLCCGYTLLWEGGLYSLKSLLLNVIADKTRWCEQFGIIINKTEWDCNSLPATLVTDMGREYKSGTFEQISELGVTVINLPPYRPELKGPVEKFFDIIQNSYKPYLIGKGVIEPDYQERGVRDYRKDACLTLEAFEKIIIHCILYYNSQRIIENFCYTEEMLNSSVQPHANCIWNFSKNQVGANLIDITPKKLMLTLLPRTEGTFSRFGLKVNKLRYTNEGYTEHFLKGDTVTVAYNPEDVSSVWIIANGDYVQFDLIETRFTGKSIDEVNSLVKSQKDIVYDAKSEINQAKISLAGHIEAIANNSSNVLDVKLKNIRNNRKREQRKKHVDYMKEGDVFE